MRPPLDRTRSSTRDASTAYLFGAVVVGATAGWMISGALLAIGLGVAMATVTTVIVGARRMGDVGKALDGSGPDVSALPARQALAALSAATGAVGNFDSPQMKALEEVAKKADADPRGALTDVERLKDEFPRSPLVTAELARRCQAVGQEDAARRAAGEAIVLALDGGMNPMAARLLAEFRGYRDDLSLDDGQRRRLAGAAEASGDDSGAAWCRSALTG